MDRVSAYEWELSKDYVQIVLGMDQLYRRHQGEENGAFLDREGLVPVNLTNVKPNSYEGWTAVIEDLRNLRIRYLSVQSDLRRNYMQQQIGSLIALAEWCAGQKIPFRKKVRRFLYVDENPLTGKQWQVLHQKLDDALTQRGFYGALPDKVKDWEEERKVPAQEIESILKELLAEAKERVVRMMFPEMEDVHVIPEVVYDVPYSAYCDYINGKMYINGDLSYTFEALKHLVAHEAFPGHTTHLRIRELGIQSGEIHLDAGLVITNTASSPIFEGIGDNGIHFIEWATSPDDRIYELYQIIRSVAGLNAVHMIHTEQKPDEEVRDFLRQFAFGHESWIDSRFRFFTHALRAPFIFSYWRGNEAVRQVFQRVPAEERLRFYHFLYKRMLSVDTVKQFV